LFVSVSVPAMVAKSASVTAVLNCAIVPEIVLLHKSIVLFVNVTVAEFLVASDVLSTFHNHTSVFVKVTTHD
jgi:hypothetical protein